MKLVSNQNFKGIVEKQTKCDFKMNILESHNNIKSNAYACDTHLEVKLNNQYIAY